MELYSLEEEECNELFLTQKDNSNVEMAPSELPLVSVNEGKEFFGEASSDSCAVQTMYSDISDPEDDFVNPVCGRTER